MISMATTAHNIEKSLNELNTTSSRQAIEDTLGISDTGVEDSLDVLDSLLKPILHFLEGTPTRAIILTAVVSAITLC